MGTLGCGINSPKTRMNPVLQTVFLSLPRLLGNGALGSAFGQMVWHRLSGRRPRHFSPQGFIDSPDYQNRTGNLHPTLLADYHGRGLRRRF